MPRLQGATNERQTCAICMNTIRRNTQWFHVTECPQPHYFHYDCWAEYRRAEQRRTGQADSLRLRCPTCRHVQISFADMSLAADLMLGRRCALCLREEIFAPMTVECGHRFCERCVVQHVRSKADSGADATCPVCQRLLLNEAALLRYLFAPRGAPPDQQTPPLGEQVLGRFRSGFLSRAELPAFCTDQTTHLLLAPEPGSATTTDEGRRECSLLDALAGWRVGELGRRLRNSRFYRTGPVDRNAQALWLYLCTRDVAW